MSPLERLVMNRQFQIAGGIVGVLVFLVSAGFLIAAKTKAPTRVVSTSSVLPDKPYDVPIMRALPQGPPMRATAASVMAYSPSSPKRTARR